MKSLAALTLVSLLFFSLNQRPKPRPTPTPPPKEHLEVEKSYDKFKDVSTFSIGGLRLTNKEGIDLELWILYIFPGKELPTKPIDPLDNKAYMVLIAKGDHYLFDRQHELIYLADGERLNFGEMNYKTQYEPPNLEERMSAFISKDTLLIIANAKSVEGELGIYEFTIEERHKKAIKSLAEQMP